MEEQLKHIELLEAYHEGKLSQEESVEFEVRLLVDKQLQEENELYTKIIFGFHDIKADQIRQNLKNIDRELDQKKPGASGNKKLYWLSGIAASVALIGLLLFKQFSATRFSSEYIPEDPGLPVLMGVDSKLEFDNAMTQFKAAEYDNAMVGFLDLHAENTGNDTILFFLGNCYLHTGNYAASIELLEQLNLQPNSAYYKKSQYYLALAYWASNDKKEAVNIFVAIAAAPNHPFQAQSIDILKKIR